MQFINAAAHTCTHYHAASARLLIPPRNTHSRPIHSHCSLNVNKDRARGAAVCLLVAAASPLLQIIRAGRFAA